MDGPKPPKIIAAEGKGPGTFSIKFILISLSTILFANLALSLLTNWIALVSLRSFSGNGVQLLALAALLIAIPRYWREAARLESMPEWSGVCFLGLAGLGSSLACMLWVSGLIRIGFLVIVFGLLWAFWGYKKARHFLPLFLLALFSLPPVPTPVISDLSTMLQQGSFIICTQAARLFIPITTYGNIFSVKGNEIEIGAPCSGASMWTALVFALVIWHVFFNLSLKQTVALLPISALLALILNSIRLLIMALVAYWANVSLALAVHGNLEFLLLPLGLLILWWAAKRWT